MSLSLRVRDNPLPRTRADALSELRALHLMEVVDPHSGLIFQAFVDVTSMTPRVGDYIVVSDGEIAVECLVRDDAPLPDGVESLGRTHSILIHR